MKDGVTFVPKFLCQNPYLTANEFTVLMFLMYVAQNSKKYPKTWDIIGATGLSIGTIYKVCRELRHLNILPPKGYLPRPHQRWNLTTRGLREIPAIGDNPGL